MHFCTSRAARRGVIVGQSPGHMHRPDAKFHEEDRGSGTFEASRVSTGKVNSVFVSMTLRVLYSMEVVLQLNLIT